MILNQTKNSHHEPLNYGFGLIETIVAMGLFLVFAVAGVSTILHSYSINRLSDEETKAKLYTQEAIEAVKSIKNENWGSITPSAGSYGLQSTNGYWELIGSQDSFDDGTFTRRVFIEEARRNAAGDIVETGGSIDPDTYKVTARTEWQFAPNRNNASEMATYITNWTKPVGSVTVADGLAVVCGSETTIGQELNNSTSAGIVWNDTSYDSNYYSFSASDPTKLTVQANGDYLLSLTFPMERTDTNNSRTRIQAEIRVNNAKQDIGVARSSYIRNAGNHSESSNHLHVLLPNLQNGDEIEVFTQAITTVDSGDHVQVTDQTCLAAEFIETNQVTFAGTATQTTSGTNLNQTEAALEWNETRKDSGYTHDNGSNPQDIILANSGNYLVLVNVPMEGDNSRQNLLGKIKLDGNTISGGEFKQGYIRRSESDTESSIHWAGVVTTTSSDQVLNITTEQEANGSTVDVGGEQATLFIQRLPSDNLYIGQGNDLTNGNNWNPSSPGIIQWSSDVEIDTTVFSHDTGSSSETITIQEDGDYYLTLNTALTSSSGRPNAKVNLLINDTPYPGAETKTHYIRGGNGHDESSASLAVLLPGLSANDTVSLEVSREADSDTLDDTTDALLMIWKKESSDTPAHFLEVVENTTSDWIDGFCIEFEITNNGPNPTYNWMITFEPNDIEPITDYWEGDFLENGGVYEVTPVSWNRIINPGQTLDGIGYCADKTGPNYLPTNIEVSIPVTQAELEVSYQTTSNWGSGYCGEFSITNTGPGDTYFWELTYNPNNSTVNSAWNGEFAFTNPLYSVLAEDWNSFIAAGDTENDIGFCADKTSPTNYEPSDISITAY